MYLIGIDPGKTTGFVKVNLADGQVVYEAKEITDTKELLDELREFGGVVVIEAFVLRKDKAIQLSGRPMEASEVIGAVKSFCTEHGINFVQQLPAVKDTVSKSLLVVTGLWRATMGKPHARDAARHVIHYCLKNRLIRPLIDASTGEAYPAGTSQTPRLEAVSSGAT